MPFTYLLSVQLRLSVFDNVVELIDQNSARNEVKITFRAQDRICHYKVDRMLSDGVRNTKSAEDRIQNADKIYRDDNLELNR